LQLGVFPSIAPYVPSKILLALQRRYHHLRGRTARDSDHETLLKELRRARCARRADAGAAAANAEIETIRLFDDSFLLLVPATERRKGPGFS
jgi:hypothetical protein